MKTKKNGLSINRIKMKLNPSLNSSFKMERIQQPKQLKQRIRRHTSTAISYPSETFQIESIAKESCKTRKRYNQFESSFIDTKKRKLDKHANKKKNHQASRIKTSHEQIIDSIGSSNNKIVTCQKCALLMQKKRFKRHFMKYHIAEKLNKGNKKSSSSAAPIRQSRLAKPRTKSLTSADKRKYYDTKKAINVQCIECGKEFVSRERCRIHYKSRHTDPSTWTHQCDKCGTPFAYSEQLHQHLRTKRYREGRCHSLKLSTSSLPSSLSFTSSHSPSISSRSFSSSGTWTATEKSHSETSSTISLQHQDDSFNCSLVSNQNRLMESERKNICDIYLFYKDLEKHKRSKNYLYGICDQDRVICNKIKNALSCRNFYTYDDQTDTQEKIEQLKAWFKTEDTEKKKKKKLCIYDTRVKCPHCDITIGSTYLNKHVTAKHTDPITWKFDCHLCEKVFPVWQYLRSHLVNFHKLELNRIKYSNEGKPLSSGEISRYFSHNKTPLAECGQFLQKSKLSRHIETKHPDSSESSADQSARKLSRTEFYRQLRKNLKSPNVPTSSSMVIRTLNFDENQANHWPNSDEDQLNGQLNENTSDLNCHELFKCSACPVIPEFASSCELINHLRTFHVLTQSTPLYNPVRPLSPEMTFLQSTSLNDSYNCASLNNALPRVSTFIFNNNGENVFNGSPPVAISGCESEQSDTNYQQPSQASKLELLSYEPTMIGNGTMFKEMEIENDNHVNI